MTILHIILCALGVMLLFFLAVMVHEFGHFLAAKLLGFKVDAFSICFGPAIWKRKIGGCEYRIGCIPLGGYVALPQLDPSSMDAIQGKHDEGKKDEKKDGEGQNSPPPPPMAAWKRIVVAVAGPLGNVVLAVLLAFIISAFAPDDEFGGYGTTIGYVDTENATLVESGVKVGDKIVSIGDEKVSFWSEVVLECHFRGNTNSGLTCVVQSPNEGELRNVVLPVVRDGFSGYNRLVGVAPKLGCTIVGVRDSSPARSAGLVQGDVVKLIGGMEVMSPTDAVEKVKTYGTNTFEIVVERKSKLLTINVSAVHDEELARPVIGVTFGDPGANIPQWMMYKKPMQQLSADAKGIFRILRALFAPKAKGEAKRAAKDMGGAGTLLFVLWNEVQAGFFHSIAFLRFLCINLAILNLLPLPVLDGGHVLFALLEMITRRRPSPKIVDVITNFFAILLIGLMALLLWRDAVRIHKFTSKAPVQHEEAAPQNE